MNRDLNHATRRLLQVVLDMLTNPNHATLMAEREETKKKGERVYDPPSPYRNELTAIEAAHRAAKEAQQMLAEAHEPALPFGATQPFGGVPAVGGEIGTAALPPLGAQVVWKNEATPGGQ